MNGSGDGLKREESARTGRKRQMKPFDSNLEILWILFNVDRWIQCGS